MKQEHIDALVEYFIILLVSACSGILLIIILTFIFGCAVSQPQLDEPTELPYYEKSYNDFDPNIDLPEKPKDKKLNKKLRSRQR